MATLLQPTCTVRLLRPHAQQERFLQSPALRKIIRAGRRSGKTTGLAIASVLAFLRGERVLYAAPTMEQLTRWWTEVTRALQEPVDAGVFKRNVTEHIIELPGTEQRLKAKTAWDPDTLRGDYCSLLFLDEFHLMHESTWTEVALPMLLDRNGRSVLCFTPPSMRSMTHSKAKNPKHALYLYRRAAVDTTGRWEAFHFSSHDNPYLSRKALDEITGDMTEAVYKQEILAEDPGDENPKALWSRSIIRYKALAEFSERETYLHSAP